MSSIESMLGLDLSSPSQRLALELAENDAYLLRNLVELRMHLGLSQTDVAGLLGVSQATVSAFESDDNDPKLSTIRRYAHAIGAVVGHSVTIDRGEIVGHLGWNYAGGSVTRGRFTSSIVPRQSREIVEEWHLSSVTA